MLVEEHFCSSDPYNQKRGRTSHRMMQVEDAFILPWAILLLLPHQVCSEVLVSGAWWQQVKRERAQRRESGLPLGMGSSTHAMPQCCTWHSSWLPSPPEAQAGWLSLGWQRAGEQTELGTCCHPRQCLSSPLSLLLQALNSTPGPKQSAYKITKFNSPFFIFFWFSV